MRPVRYRKLGSDRLQSISVSGRWLVTLQEHFDQSASVYSLPGLQPQSELADVGSGCLNIRADTEGQVFVACTGRIVLLEISETGNLTFSRNLTAGGRLDRRRNTVAVGPRPGQLWVAQPPKRLAYNACLMLLHVDTDTVIQQIDMLVDSSWTLLSASQLMTGELLVTVFDYVSKYSIVHLYQSDVTLPPTNLTVTGKVLLSHRNHFLLLDWHTNTILILDNQGDLVHTVGDLNGKHGIWMTIEDVAVGENTFLVCDLYNGNVMLFSMI